ncbi:MAG TPA: phosphoadenosine phosphosulfate reductase family protein, partial [Longimicrobiaceae bacterium]|nr:phosphoadenosine phosphosulfate reductase family protein [Longimicrobiaceae bacterium]
MTSKSQRGTLQGAQAVYSSVLGEALELLGVISREFRPAALASGFGPESMILIDLIAKNEFDIEIFSIDTGRLPEETHELAYNIHKRYGPLVRIVSPDPQRVAEWTLLHGQNAFYESTDLRHQCCAVRKVEPLQQFLCGKKAWLTGLRRQHSPERAMLELRTWDAR